MPLSTYGWNVPDEMQEFQMFKHQFTSWKKICWIHQMRWSTFSSSMPTDPTDTNDAWKFLDYLESTLDGEISPHVRVYELEDVKKRTDETIDAIIDCIH